MRAFALRLAQDAQRRLVEIAERRGLHAIGQDPISSQRGKWAGGVPPK